jgi:fumarylacetoacetate (FAA) hydrolase family protein
MDLSTRAILPIDAAAAILLGRVWRPDIGPSVVAVRPGGVFDITGLAPTMADLLNLADPVASLRRFDGEPVGDLAAILANSAHDQRNPSKPWFLAPCDLQAVKAAGVTFVTSMLERVIEEQVRGDASQADAVRASILASIGGDLASLRPGSPEAMRLKQVLIERGAWSQYLEVGIGPDAEIFTKAQPLSSVGIGAEIGIHPASSWNNPEPEVVLAINAAGRIVGATLGNDVNLRDVEGRSALLLGKAKDNAASSAIGPFIRLLDDRFTLDDLRQVEVLMRVEGLDQFVLEGKSSLGRISRDITDLAGQLVCSTHQYPDGAMLYTGTMFAPTKDRGAPGRGFTHQVGDVVTIASPRLGALTNRVNTCDKVEPWTMGAAALMKNLAARKLL